MEKDRRTMTVEAALARIAREMGIGYLNETWARANTRLDKFRRCGDDKHVEDTDPERVGLPCLLNVQNITGNIIFTSGGLVKDSPNLLLAFCDAMPFDFTGAQAQEAADRLRDLAERFIAAMGASGLFEALPQQVPYRVGFDQLDACLCILSVDLTATELAGHCCG